MKSFRFKHLTYPASVLMIAACQTGPVKSTDFTEDHSFTSGVEGPAVSPDGDLFAVNFEKEGTIGKVDADGKGTVFLVLPENSVGNGIRFDLDGNMFIADYVNHNVFRVDAGTNIPKVWVHHDQMNQPNDLAISSRGILYLSDPNWKDNSGNLWMVNTSGNIFLLESGMGTTNGIEVSPDGRKLYVNESVQRNVWQYDILEDGTVENKKKLIDFPDHGMDGMRCDEKGNLYIARYDKGVIAIVSPEGVLLDEVTLTGQKPTNITFGGKDGKTCFVTLQDRGCIETFRAEYPGSFFKKVNHN